jgi:hypothetical protein
MVDGRQIFEMPVVATVLYLMWMTILAFLKVDRPNPKVLRDANESEAKKR